MIAWELVDEAPLPGGRERLSLHRRGDEFSIRVDGRELMSSRRHGSEQELGRRAGEPSAGRARAGNDALYGEAGLALAVAALRPLGPLWIWSAGPQAGFVRRLRGAGFATTEREVREPPGRAASRGRRPRSPWPLSPFRWAATSLWARFTFGSMPWNPGSFSRAPCLPSARRRARNQLRVEILWSGRAQVRIADQRSTIASSMRCR